MTGAQDDTPVRRAALVALALAAALAVGSPARGAVRREVALPDRPDLAGVEPVQVLRVIDGDTIEVQAAAGSETVRLIGVDTPELGSEPYAQEAAVFLFNLLAGESVYLVSGKEAERDRHGRLLAYLYRAPDGLFVDLEIVRQGYGRVYLGAPFEHREAFQYWEARAKAASKGMWNPALRAASVAPTTAAPHVARPPAPAPPTRPQVEATVYVTRTGEKYHRGSCRYLRRSRIPMSLEDARGGGYTPCSVCRPPR